MTPRHQISRAAIELIKRFEGYRRRAALLPDGGWTIGYGHTLTARKGAEVSEADAEALLVYDLIAVAHVINEGVFAPLTANQFDALCSFVFNIGTENFKRSAVIRRLNEGAYLKAACAMELWRKSDLAGEQILIDSLVRRRSAEKALFLTPQEGWLPAPTPILRPALDVDGPCQAPWRAPEPLGALPEDDTVSLVPSDGLEGEAAAEPDGAPAETPFALTAPEEPAPEGSSRIFGRRAAQEAEGSPNLFDGERAPANDTPGATDWPAAAPVRRAGMFAKPELRAARRLGRVRKPDLSALWGLCAAGLGLLLLGLVSVINRPAAAGAPVGLTILGWAAGLIGVALFSLAAYRLLRRLGMDARD